MAASRNGPEAFPVREPTTNAGRDPLSGDLVPHARNEHTAGQVEAMAALGCTAEEIAVALDLRPGQVRHYYAVELAAAPVRANVAVAKAFFDVAKSGTSWQASAAWLRARAGWSDGEQSASGGGISINIHI